VTEIVADQGGMNLGVAAVGDDFNFYFGGSTDFLIKEDGELQFNTAGKQHKIVPQTTSFDIVSENQSDAVELWTGSGRTNATLFVEDTESVFSSETDVTTRYDVILRQNNLTPVNGRAIGVIAWQAENSTSVLEDYAIMEGEMSVVTAGSEQGRWRVGVQVNSVAGIVGLELIGVSTAIRFGAFGVTPVVQQVVAGGASVATVITALKNLGWFV